MKEPRVSRPGAFRFSGAANPLATSSDLPAQIARVEYRYSDFGTFNHTFFTTPATATPLSVGSA